ncbi:MULTISPECIES: alanyl-tRNA editing protein [unclassified Exiguobacterium]|uniref:alanyl-tRNA editing protein n=1 Tax=unclassified Exiguobacterium TaxID=2644629 RepID=UPI00103F9957|nr:MULTISPECIES: alanyl-tRNA editing protein [unclassified Exiguobacterium]TCI35163.1 alanyl-tRNA editing protein [Exiguobacterium sp. SH4S7]TCI44709.1 alanyl-tRNA editing protein [Exiguobacterium sp. SH5S32]TCI51116.1 alanyl-tRNA editing protein [Exiguobacterium sp. SH1S4]TCI59859.1 alanyl-tRNA editing protein [Exiguobacterium sp. SH0S2]TCI70090.1 alanyl-tRNA editing protein [Exiguobacterium sp. SH1S1]
MNSWQFETTVTAQREDERGTWIALAATHFYAEGGGQPADTGTIGGQAVLDVQRDDSTVWHLVNEPIDEATVVIGQIDAATRHDHSIQHTAQHVLTALLEDRYGIETLSFGISADDSSIEIAAESFDWELIETLERDVQQIIFDNRPIHIFELQDGEVEHDRLRKATDRTGTIRIVEIDGLDYNACGGTHVSTTGQLGIIKVTSMKKVRGNVRLTYVAGMRALTVIQSSRTALRAIHQTLSTTNETVAARVAEERTARLEREKEVKVLEARVAKAKVAAFLQEDNYVITHIGKTEAETLTTMIVERIAATGRIAVGANHTGQKLLLMHDGTHDIAIGKFLKRTLDDLGIGRGGGSHKQAQARFESIVDLERATAEVVKRLQEGVVSC